MQQIRDAANSDLESTKSELEKEKKLDDTNGNDAKLAVVMAQLEEERAKSKKLEQKLSVIAAGLAM